jgi:para-aminobenzoate synthetase
LLRILLIDNYDSYTYNLFQLLTLVSGFEPTVIMNDEHEFGDLDASRFDAVVISPGPGRPERWGDFGISGEVLRHWNLPCLGVCLGHQGMGHVAGAIVGPAPTPLHGHVTRINHDGKGLFTDIPQGFMATRYHSLHLLRPLPEELSVTAWAEDGVIMGIRHRSRPWWGVQFHPESIASEFGKRIIENFNGLARLNREVLRNTGTRSVSHDSGAAASTPRIDPRNATEARASGSSLCLHWRRLDFAVDTEAIFSDLYAGSSYAFWLDGGNTDGRSSRFSFMGDASGPLSEILTYSLATGEVQIERAASAHETVAGDIFKLLDQRLVERRIESSEFPFNFNCGYVGFLGYELKALCGSPNRHESETPDSIWIFADRLICVDHLEQSTYLLALGERSARSNKAAKAWLAGTAQLLVAQNSSPNIKADDVLVLKAQKIPDPETQLVRDRTQYLADINECKHQLIAGETYEICLTNKLRLPMIGSPLDFYRRLRLSNPAPYAAFLRFRDVVIASSSPERFITIDQNKMVESKPIKGTIRRDGDAEIDRELAQSLQENSKTRAENLMIVDLVRNDLGRVCIPGSISVPKLMDVESYSTVHQLVSTVQGTLAEGISAVQCIRAVFPGGSMTGAPKMRTLAIIDRLETEARGIYSGTLGYLGLNGTCDMSIVIRTAVIHGREMSIGVGGAIVLNSDPLDEFEEMLLKGMALLRSL